MINTQYLLLNQTFSYRRLEKTLSEYMNLSKNLDDLKFDNLDENNIGLRRSGNGLEAKTILKIHGKKAKRKISKGKLIKLEDFDQ